MSTLWEFVDQQDEEQLDFFDLCEPVSAPIDSGLESQTPNEGKNGKNEPE